MKYEGKRIFALHNSTGCRLWRLYPQLAYARSQGVETTLINGAERHSWPEIAAEIARCDVVVFQATFDGRTLETALDLGKKVIFEFDDLLHEVPPRHPMKDKINDTFRQGVFKMIKDSDMCITTNQLLKDEYSHLNENIEIFPNYVKAEDWIPEKAMTKTRSRTIRLGWAGGISHVDDLEFIKPVLSRILDKYENVKFVYCGGGGAWSDNALTTFNYGEDLFKEIPPERREYIMGSTPECWPTKLRSLRFDIGIAPLIDDKFNHRKTPIKWMEYGINKVPSVCQDFLYDQVITDGVDGYLAKTQDDYFNKLSMLIEDEDKRKEMGKRAFDSVITKHNFNDHGGQWLDIVFKT
jgi:glycosyltransferase involved in cell wall biosynthesis